MTWHLNNLRSNILGGTPSTAAITATPNLTSPIGASSDPYDATTLTWDPVPNATHYIVEINIATSFPSGQLMKDEVIVANATSYTTTQLDANKNYHWRIIPYSDGHFCASPSSSKSFSTSNYASNVNTIQGVEEVQLMPNPANRGQLANLVIKSDKAFEAGITIYDVSGRLVSMEQKTVASGSTVHPINTTDLSAGIYIVAVQSANGVINNKLVITE
jgi:hypothetical protein